MRAFPALLALLFALAPAAAQDWSRYENARYGYAVDIPPGYSPITEADNGDGGKSESADGSQALSVFGAMSLTGDFRTEVTDRIALDEQDGWELSYRRETPRWASWSGSREGRILYQRAVALCDGSAAFFRLEYDRADLAALDRVVVRLVETLRPARPC